MFLVLVLVAFCAALCSGDNLRKNYVFDGERIFKEKAMNNTPKTDKVTDHSYQKNYTVWTRNGFRGPVGPR